MNTTSDNTEMVNKAQQSVLGADAVPVALHRQQRQPHGAACLGGNLDSRLAPLVLPASLLAGGNASSVFRQPGDEMNLIRDAMQRNMDIFVETPSSISRPRDLFMGLISEIDSSNNSDDKYLGGQRRNDNVDPATAATAVAAAAEAATGTDAKKQEQPQQHQSTNIQCQFPWKMHEMLDNAAIEGYDDIVSWLPDNKSFKVHKPHDFAAENGIMQRFFKQTKFKSFRRQINMWGFERIKDQPGKGGYHSPHFIRGKPSLCYHMKRMKVKGVAMTAPTGILAGSIPSAASQSAHLALPTEKPTAGNQQISAHDNGIACTRSSFGVKKPPPSWLREHESSLLEFARQQVIRASIRATAPSISPTLRSSPIDSLTTSSEGGGAVSSSCTSDDEIVDELISTFL